MESSPLITGSVLAILVLVSLQGIVLSVTIFLFLRKLSALQGKTKKMGAKVHALLEQGDRLLSDAERLHARVPEQLEKVTGSIQWMTQRIGEVDDFAGQNLAIVKRQLENVSHTSDDLLSGFSVATFRIHRAVINPTRHIAAALSAIQESVLWLLTRGRQKESDPAHPDEQIFI